MTPQSLDGVFAALADPTRRAIIDRLAEGEASVGDIAARFPLSLPTVSRHLDVLEGARLIARRKEAQRRVCSLRPEPLMAMNEWLARYAAFWESRLDALQKLVEAPEKEAPQ